MKEYREQFLPQMTKVGRFIMTISLLLFFVPFFVLWFVYGVQPQWSHLVKALVPWLLINLPWWISNPISYFPILGIPGTLLCFLSGNIANMRIPAGVAAQKAAEQYQQNVERLCQEKISAAESRAQEILARAKKAANQQ